MRVRLLVQLSTSLALVVGLTAGLTQCGETKVVDDPSDASETVDTDAGETNTSACDSSKCAPENTCIEHEGVTECRLTCESQRGAKGCPANYTCIQSGDVAFCKEDKYSYEPRAGQWGFPCAAQEGLFASQCDQENGFYCLYGEPNDPYASCTSSCTDDTDCTGGYYCGNTNDIPASAREKRTVGAVHRLCLPRAYCAPCENDVDCGPAANGNKQYCVGDANGKGICTPTCDSDGACNDEASCLPLNDTTKICYPIAQVCVGDGNLCSPCHSDADCAAGGACVDSAYTTERTCSTPSKVKCNLDNETKPFDCPKETPPGAAAKSFVSCVGEVYKEVPRDQCTGLVYISNDSPVVGCYARGGRR